MAKSTITAGCGHTSEVQLYGPEKERERRIEWMQSDTGKCNRCYAATKRADEAGYAERMIELKMRELEAQWPAEITAAQVSALHSGALARRGESRAEAALRVLAAKGLLPTEAPR